MLEHDPVGCHPCLQEWARGLEQGKVWESEGFGMQKGLGCGRVREGFGMRKGLGWGRV